MKNRENIPIFHCFLLYQRVLQKSTFVNGDGGIFSEKSRKKMVGSIACCGNDI